MTVTVDPDNNHYFSVSDISLPRRMKTIATVDIDGQEHPIMMENSHGFEFHAGLQYGYQNRDTRPGQRGSRKEYPVDKRLAFPLHIDGKLRRFSDWAKEIAENNPDKKFVEINGMNDLSDNDMHLAKYMVDVVNAVSDSGYVLLADPDKIDRIVSRRPYYKDAINRISDIQDKFVQSEPNDEKDDTELNDVGDEADNQLGRLVKLAGLKHENQ